MDPRKLVKGLTAVGAVTMLGAIGWWYYFYSQVLKMDVEKVVSCLYSTGGGCGIVSGLSRFGGATPYEPMLLWFGAGAFGVGLIVWFSLKNEA